MLKKYQVTKMIDDLDGSEATRTIRFSIDGAHYTIDLSDENADKFREAFAPYIANGRRVTSRNVTSRKSSRRSSSASTGRAQRQKTAEIRAWAIEKGYTSSTRGRLGPTIIEAYEAAHQNADAQ